jgi:hypothetical protein
MNFHSEAHNGFRVCKGNFIGIVQPHDGQYEFIVRDMRRESPTINGSGVDLAHATDAVTQLMEALLRER